MFLSDLGIPRKQPTLTTEKTLRIYVRHDGELPVMLDWLLRFAWILNLIGLSGIVLHCLTSLQVSIDLMYKRILMYNKTNIVVDH